MAQETTQPPTDFFHVLAEQGQGYDVLADSTALLDLSDELLGSATPETAVEVAFNILHPERAINRRGWSKVNWQEQSTPDRKKSAANVLGTLLLNRTFTDNKEGGVENAIIGLPTFENDHIITPTLDIDELSNNTGLSRERVVLRRYEALAKLAEIWNLEFGTSYPTEHAEIKAELLPKIFDTYGQLGYGLVGALYKNEATHPFIYLDRVFNGKNPNNPLHDSYSNGIAGYNKYANSGREAIIRHLETSEFTGSQELLDNEALENLEQLKGMQEKLSEISRLYTMSNKKLTGWLADSADTLGLEKAEGFTQAEAFRLAELRMEIEKFRASDNELQKYADVVENEQSIRNIAEAFRQANQELPIGVATIVSLLDGQTLNDIALDSKVTVKLVGTRVSKGLGTLKNMLTRIPNDADLSTEQAKKLITPTSATAPKPKVDKESKKPAKNSRVPKSPTHPAGYIEAKQLPPEPEDSVIKRADVKDALSSVLDPGDANWILESIPGSDEGRIARLTRELNSHAEAYNNGDTSKIPPKLLLAFEVLFGEKDS